jgi:putative transposase
MSFSRPTPQSSRTLMRAVGRQCRKHLVLGVRQTGADRWVKKYGSVGFATALIGYFLIGVESLRDLRVWLANSKTLYQAVGWQGISVSQLIKLQHRRPPQLWAPLLAALINRTADVQVPRRLRLMDTSFFRMSLKLLSRHYDKRMDRSTSGFKLGLVLDPQSAAPVHIMTQVGQGADTLCLDALVPPSTDISGQTFLFDRGFVKYSFYQDLIARGAHFVTRALSGMHHKVCEKLALDPTKPEIVADEVVIIGRRESRNEMTSPLRRIVLQTATETLVFLTSDFELTAWEVTQLYKRRWEIEIFFRWLKRNLNCLRPLGHSIEAAEHAFYAALVAHLLVMLLMSASEIEAKPKTQRGLPFRATLHRIRATIHQPPNEQDLQALSFL